MGRHSEVGLRQRNGAQFSPTTETDQSITPLIRKSPAFTHYRLSRLSRGEDDDEDDDEDDEDETEESEDLDEGIQSIENAENKKVNLSSLSSVAEKQIEAPRSTRKQYRGRTSLFSKNRSPLVMTTVVGNSRMATAVRRGDRSNGNRKVCFFIYFKSI